MHTQQHSDTTKPQHSTPYLRLRLRCAPLVGHLGHAVTAPFALGIAVSPAEKGHDRTQKI